MSMPLLPLLIVTLALAAISLMAIRSLSLNARPTFVYGLLTLIAGVYVGFAVIHLDSGGFITRPLLSIIVLEGLIAVAFLIGGLAALLSRRPWILGVLILVHGAVDLIHLLAGAAHAPDWYVFACILYDCIVGLGAIILLSPPTQKSAPHQTSPPP